MAIVRLYGDLERYGRKFNLNVINAAEAIRALTLQIPGLRQHMQSDYYRVRIAGNDINENALQAGMLSVLKETDVIHIIPRALGAKNAMGILQFVAGAAMVVVGIYTQNYGLVGAGVGLMLGGVATMLTKMPKTKTAEEGATNNNTAFSNLDNTIAQGQPVPLCYGRMMIGSKVLSQGLSTE
ncbi:tail assembly protein [Budviciaceae bacterium BWR-B9]|uniref:Tail assembly protein n=2 Tax=Limnobaculum TaxID=2172100 RepID=A0A9D7FRI6_9GAMM|nr:MULTISPECIES: tail assembly protein [Limnobaculum]MBK5072239.1 tail assembly protein [Limnobaculum xujianqingii]MBK5146011.1 tail assembly protein [Limnobaculum allomyrinae]MBK5175548.1 tail assembly protein [Limnobaculum xujianqingii]MBV7694052.1 tail assembly protein [Limnobaculum sp. M2-1]